MKQECEVCEAYTYHIKKGKKEGYEEILQALEEHFEKNDGEEYSAYLDGVDDCISIVQEMLDKTKEWKI